LWICAQGFPDGVAVPANSPDGINNSATISWPASIGNLEGIVLSIEEEGVCS
jgi:hypothetical protein